MFYSPNQNTSLFIVHIGVKIVEVTSSVEFYVYTG